MVQRVPGTIHNICQCKTKKRNVCKWVEPISTQWKYSLIPTAWNTVKKKTKKNCSNQKLVWSYFVQPSQIIVGSFRFICSYFRVSTADTTADNFRHFSWLLWMKSKTERSVMLWGWVEVGVAGWEYTSTTGSEGKMKKRKDLLTWTFACCISQNAFDRTPVL